MGAAWVWSRTQWRRRRGAALAGTLLFALAVGVVLSAIAGARRTQTAFPRMVEAVSASDVLANPDLGVDTTLDFDRVEALPGVESIGVAAGMAIVPADVDGNPDFSVPILSIASADREFGYSIDRPLLEAGRLPDPDAADEAVIDPELATRLGVSVGDTVEMVMPDFASPPPEGEEPGFLPVPLTVTGIGLSTSQILTDETFAQYHLLLSPAYFEANPRAVGFWGLAVQLDDPSPAGILAFRRAVDELVPDEGIEYRAQAVDDDAVRRAVEPQVVALYLFGALVGLAALVIVAQSLGRQLVLGDQEAQTLQSLGLERRTLFLGGMLRALALATMGAALGVALAAAASSRFPVGFVRRAEPSPGVDVNVAILAGGALLAVVLLVALVALPVWRGTGLASRAPATARPTRSVTLLRRWGAGPAVVSGVHLALQSAPGRPTGRVRASLLGGLLVVTLLSAAVSFGASLEHLVDTPTLYGWSWDATVDANTEQAAVGRALDHDERVDQWSPMSLNRLVVEGVPVPTVGVSPRADAITPTIVEGRPPRTADEIVLGGRTMERLDAPIGDTVTVTAHSGTSEDLEVVGRAVFPGVGTYSGSERTELGTGAMTTIDTLAALGPAVDKGAVVIRLRPGADVAAFSQDTTEVLLAAGADEDEAAVTTGPRRPTDIVALGRVREAPGGLALLMAGLILVQLIITVFTAGRGRRRDLALLGTIGFVRRQVAATVCWQSLTVVLVALVVGVPLGVAVGRALWTVLGDQLGVVPDPVTPVGALAPLVAGVLVAGAVISYAGGALLARKPPATSLRSE